MLLIRILSLPIVPFYTFIIWLRNFSYNRGWINSNSFDIPVVGVGNLSVGGTGKTPQTEYIIRLLKDEFKVGVVSRGYRRKTQGYMEVEPGLTASLVGDEPLQMKRKFNDAIVCVDESRLSGITNMLIDHDETDVVLLDDCYQHRAIKPGVMIMLTTFDEPFFNDYMIPFGDLREFRSGRKRADLVVVTKCPDDISIEQMEDFIKKMKLEAHQQVFFSKIAYHKCKDVFSGEEFSPAGKVVLLTGIAKSDNMKSELEARGLEVEHMEFRDHHPYSDKDVSKIKDIFNNFGASCVITTEKDAVRLYEFKDVFEAAGIKLVYLEIQSEIINNGEKFDHYIKSYVRENKDKHRVPQEQDTV